MSDVINITLPDGSVRQYPAGTTIREVATSIGKRLGKDAIGGLVDAGAGTKVIDVHTPLQKDAKLRIVTVGSAEGLEVLRHSTAHLLASAVQRLYPGTQVTIGPAIDAGFYYDFKRDEGFTPDDLERIEVEMRRIAEQNLPFVREEVSRDQAVALFEKMGETFKVELVKAIPQGDPITLYKHGDWADLCRGPHVPATGALKAFKLTHVSGAYWRGDERNPQLARIYGTAFWDQKALDEHTSQLEEAKKRDHRKIGKELELFFFHPIAPAMPFFMPKGTAVYNTLLEFIRGYYRAIGFDEVITPQIVDAELFHRSGHYAHYKENMFFSHIDEREYGAKPMNCPGHTLIYAEKKHSYRELPIRLADFGRLHRYERSGVTAGLTRVRSFSQDDAHIFCREDQIESEIKKQILMIRDVYSHFGMEMRVFFSTRPESSLGREPGLSDAEKSEWDDIWRRAESNLESAIKAADLGYTTNRGDGAFYGPKLDCQVKDAIGRWHQLGTVQLDFGLPRRFDLTYVNEKSAESRPVMIHRAVLGSLERFIGILLEHTAGDLPVWLAPEQVRVVTVADDFLPYAREVSAALVQKGLRVHLEQRSEKLGFKIRDAELHKVPFVFVIGAKEQAGRAVAVRARKRGDLGQLALDQAIEHVLNAAALPTPGPALVAAVSAPASL
jgi:threonyl-tRNA synthetase